MRLRTVIASARLAWLDGVYAFEEHPVERLPAAEAADALALVRDHEVWSVLKRASGGAAEQFSLFSVHFVPGLDNSGFVGWLASRFKRDLGTGVFVICGQNSRDGGIFDYWGVPVAQRAQAEQLLMKVRSEPS